MFVDLASIKSHLNVVGSDDDALLTGKIAAATVCVENYIGKPLADFDPLPEPIREAILQLTAHFYENREPFLVGMSAATLPWNAIDLIQPYRQWVFG